MAELLSTRIEGKFVAVQPELHGTASLPTIQWTWKLAAGKADSPSPLLHQFGNQLQLYQLLSEQSSQAPNFGFLSSGREQLNRSPSHRAFWPTPAAASSDSAAVDTLPSLIRIQNYPKNDHRYCDHQRQ
jgi:hypothetical protein